MEFARAHIFISGIVQGVFFRASTADKAQELELTGWVKNLPDGRVEAVIEGPKDKIEEMIEWMKKGPRLAKVDEVEMVWEEYKGEFGNFEIR